MNTHESIAAPVPQVPRVTFLRDWIAAAGNLYCRTFHRSISRPVGGKYQCWKCLREFDLEW